MTPLQLASSLRLTNAFHLLEEAFLLSENQNNYCSTSPAEDQYTTTLPHHLNQIPCQFAHANVHTCSDDADDVCYLPVLKLTAITFL